MHPNPARLKSTAIGIVMCCFAIAAPARSQDASSLQCPSGYWLYGSLCLNNGSGDVVYASTQKAARAESEAGCTPGYWRYGELCMSSATGDVEMADEQRRTAAGLLHGKGKQ